METLYDWFAKIRPLVATDAEAEHYAKGLCHLKDAVDDGATFDVQGCNIIIIEKFGTRLVTIDDLPGEVQNIIIDMIFPYII